MSESRLKKVLVTVGTILMITFCLSPFFWMILISLTDNPGFLSDRIDLRITLTNYTDLLVTKSLHFLDYLRNSLIVGGTVSVICGLIASLGAYAVSRLQFTGRVLLPLAILALSMFPQISIVGYLSKLAHSAGLINTHIVLILPYIAWTIPLAFWILLSHMVRIPTELDDAGLVDGAGRFTIFRRLIMPVMAPGLLSAILLVFIAAFNEFLFALMLTTDHNARTIPVGIALFEGLHGEIPWGYIMAASSIASLPLVGISLYFQQYIIRDVTRGALKG